MSDFTIIKRKNDFDVIPNDELIDEYKDVDPNKLNIDTNITINNIKRNLDFVDDPLFFFK